ncbi:MAG TPA: malto-oligosyltrehalose trehalohydrolase [Polyangiaceae bacterium]|nr:malto-oligosyltrehalose trehalohydrolase [Polyangiaceae bacterium]
MAPHSGLAAASDTTIIDHERGGRRRRLGAELIGGGVDFRLSAPRCRHVNLILESEGGRLVPMERAGRGEFSAFVPGLRAGALYRFLLDDDRVPYPDPASRYQPEGPHGPSLVVDPTSYEWRDRAHAGVHLEGQVLYEAHIGTLTPEGTFLSAARELPGLAELGITTIEVMPVAEFPGRFGWGYDGVCLYAPSRLYGTPDDFRFFVDEAHRLGMGVILDVVYNHFGPDGCYVTRFSDSFFSKQKNEWGAQLNFDREGSQEVRTFFTENAAYWIDEFHLDGLRLDATQEIHDGSDPHIVTEIVQAARDAASPRTIVVFAEHEQQHSHFARSPDEGGKGIDAMWNDDFHHSAAVAATGHAEAYYSDTLGTPQELISAIRWGYLFQGQRYAWQNKNRGEPGLDLSGPNFVVYLENHDQVANSAFGRRLHQQTSPGRSRALTALLLLAPGTPLLFQGQEYDATTPFFYFADHGEELAALVSKGRAEMLGQFPSVRDEAVLHKLANPAAVDTFARSRLDPAERARNRHPLAFVRALLALRKSDVVFRSQRAERIHGAVLGPEAFLLRYMGELGDDRLVLVNLGRDLDVRHAAEPLIAPPRGRKWTYLLSSEAPEFGGSGTPPLDSYEHLRLHGHSTLVLTATPEDPA